MNPCDPCAGATSTGASSCVEAAPVVKMNNIPVSSTTTTTSRSVILLATPYAVVHVATPNSVAAPIATPRILTSQIMIVGCPNYKAPASGSRMIGGDTCTPTLLSRLDFVKFVCRRILADSFCKYSTGEGLNLGSPDAAQFSFNALNGTCSGIEMPITLKAVGSTTSTFSTTNFTLDCTNPVNPRLHPVDPTRNHFCMIPQSDVQVNVSI